MKKPLLALLVLVFFVCLFVGCEKQNSSVITNKDKPLIFFNRQPSNPVTGAVDIPVMSWNRSTYYVGFDVTSGGASQGKLITDFLETSSSYFIDRNGDGIIGYVLCIGDSGSSDSKARTEGIRRALGTWSGAADSIVKKDGSAIVGGRTLKVVELESKVMLGQNGSTWNAEAAGVAMAEWLEKYGNQIDMVISNNDAMAMACLNTPGFPKGLPIFGFDASAEAVDSISRGILTGTVSQNDDAQAIAIIQLLRNLLDGLVGTDVYTKGFKTPDEYGNKLLSKIEYQSDVRGLFAPDGGPVNADNWYEYKGFPRDRGVKQIDAPTKKVLVVIANETDNLMSSAFLPSLEYYAKLLNLELTFVQGDGQDELSCLDQFIGVAKYDAYAINMVKTGSGRNYTDKLKDLY